MTALLVVAALLGAVWLKRELKQSEKRRRAAIELHLTEIINSKENS